ncbi:glycosyl hydrolase [Lyophyllum atratum]|nr:glycosyl hydrolase [Lyophyllum atratum]
MRAASLLLLAITWTPASVLSAKPSSLVAAGGHVIWSYPGLTPPQSIYDAISAGHAAGVIFFGENIAGNVTHISNVVASLKAANAKSPTKLPLLLMTDQEGGKVRRLPGEPVQSAKQMCGNGTAGTGGTGAGLNLKSVGMNVNLAPVLDVFRTPGDFDDQWQRSFSNDTKKVSACGSEFILAQQAEGVAAAAKHFPGLGAAPASANTDLVPVTLNLTASEIRDIDEYPFRAAIAAGVKLVMASWATYPSIDAARPAGMSSAFVIGELRNRLGFRGVTITDAIEAGSLSAFGNYGDRAVLASEAGMDLILASARDIAQGDSIVTALANALDTGAMDKKAFDRATSRIVSLRKSFKRSS